MKNRHGVLCLLDTIMCISCKLKHQIDYYLKKKTPLLCSVFWALR